MEAIQKEKAPKRKVDVTKWLGWIIALALLIGVVVYVIFIRDQILFTVLHPQSVKFCQEGYNGEHADADRNFEKRQTSKIISPIPEATESSKKE